MSDELALLAAIRDNPDEDTPRLVYADWLDENATSDADRARAEFIRVQIESAALYDQRDAIPERYNGLQQRERELLARHRGRWLAEFAGAAVVDADFSGGFLSRVEFHAGTCSPKVRPLWHREPVAAATLKGNVESVRWLCKDWLSGVSNLTLGPKTESDADPIAEAVAGSPCAARLLRLSLWHEGYSDRALNAVGASFPALTELSCFGQFTPDGWARVLASSAGTHLTDLTIGHRAPWPTADTNRPGPALARVLVDAPVHARLEFLWLCEVGLGNAGLTDLASQGRFTRLAKLHIDNDRLGAEGIRALATRPPPALRHIRFSQDELDDDALSALCGAPLLSQIEQLDLSMNRVTAGGAGTLARSGRTGVLKYLDLSFNEIGDEGAVALAQSPHLAGLEELHLSGARLTDVGADAIQHAPWAARVKTLFLSFNDITAAKAEELKRRFGSALWIKDDVV